MDQQDTQSQHRCCDEYEEYRRQQQWKFSQTRRDFLKTTVGAMAMAPMFPHLLLKSTFADHIDQSNTDPILVVVQLQGGNDGLNTIVPYGSDVYYADRPHISVPAKSVLPIDKMVGLNPNLKSLKPLYDAGKVAIVQGVGYPNPDLSHFLSTSIWETADTTGTSQTGWLGRYIDTALTGNKNPMKALALGPSVPQTLLAKSGPVPSIESVDTFRFLVNRQDAQPILDAYRIMYSGHPKDVPPYIGLVRQVEANTDQSVTDLQSVSTKYKSSVTYPQNPLARELQLVSQIIGSGLGTRIFHVTLGGFDDHVAEVYTHARLMQAFADSVAAFHQDLQNQGKADQVVIMTFSEFGRRVKENAGLGTDHGTAAPLFVIGNKVKGGIYGDDPILNNLDSDGDLKFGVDFRSVYKTVLEGWMGGDSNTILGGSYERLPFL